MKGGNREREKDLREEKGICQGGTGLRGERGERISTEKGGKRAWDEKGEDLGGERP